MGAAGEPLPPYPRPGRPSVAAGECQRNGEEAREVHVLIRVLTTGERIVSKKSYPCPTGKVINKHYAGKDFHGKGQFTTFVQLQGLSTEGHLTPRSPWLNLK